MILDPNNRHIAKSLAKTAQQGLYDRMTDLTPLEERIAHLTRMVDDLSDVVARQEGDIARLTRRVQLLIDREATRADEADDAAPLADQRPPHW